MCGQNESCTLYILVLIKKKHFHFIHIVYFYFKKNILSVNRKHVPIGQPTHQPPPLPSLFTSNNNNLCI